MEYVVTSEEMQNADKMAFSDSCLSSRAVIEVAGRQVCALLLEKYPTAVNEGVIVLCGPKNNGADGYALARGLHLLGVKVLVVSLNSFDSLTGDCLSAYQAYEAASGELLFVDGGDLEDVIPTLSASGVIVDAMFGTGLQGPLRSPYAELVDGINEICSKNRPKVVAIDIPSGLDASKHTLEGSYLNADLTVALQALKIAHVQLPAADVSGELYCADIGISLDQCSGRRLISAELVKRSASDCLQLSKDSHKGSRGYVQILGGSPGYFGAPQLSAQAASNSGAGVVELLLPYSAMKHVAPFAMEFLCRGLASDEDGALIEEAKISVSEFLAKTDSLVVGPGMGLSSGSKAVLCKALSVALKRDILTVIDADGITLVAADDEFIKLLGEHVILTPHPGEMGRLLGISTEEVQQDRIAAVVACSEKYSSWVLLKGAYSLICSPKGDILVSPFANGTLATAGSGDVLAGCLGALGAKRSSWQDIAALGVFVHGLAGELIAESDLGVFGGTAPNIVSYLPHAFKYLSSVENPPLRFVRNSLPFSFSNGIL